MKKALSALIVALFCVLILVGCREKEKETAPDNAETNADHAHAFGIFLEHSSPTCTEPGSERAYCAYCEAYMEEMIAPLGHEMEGLRCEGRVCTRCGYEEAPGEHEFEEVLSLRPDCVSKGVIEYECGCGESYTETLPATGHEYGGWSTKTEATCTEEGSKKRSCTKCGHEETASVEAPGHSYKERITKAPSCEEEGVLLKECTRCEATEEEAISAKGHKWEYKETTKATCTEDGMEKYECAACDKARDEVIEVKLNHDFGDAPECLEGVKCTRCGFTRNAMPHYFGERTTAPGCTTEGYTEKFCIFCGETFERVSETDALGHEFEEYISDNNATCTEDGTETAKCTRCDKTDTRTASGSAKGHDYGEWVTVTSAGCTEDGVEEQSCSRCGLRKEKSIPAKGHNEETETKEATCTEEGYIITQCTTCNEVLSETTIPAKGHTGGEATCTAKAVCEVCNEPYGEPATHETEEEIISPTCTEKGYILRSCKHCDFSERVSETDALGHEFEEYISDNNATCTEDGTETAKCTRCDETDTRTVSGSAKGHDYGEWIITSSAGCTEDGEERRYCAACSNYESRALSPAGHVTKETRVEATCTEEGYIITQCTTCNEILSETTIPAKGHTGGEATCTAKAVCEVCKKPYGEYGAHKTILYDGAEATCTQPGCEPGLKCELCGLVISEPVQTEIKGHTIVSETTDPTCTEPGYTKEYCSVCGEEINKEEREPALGHSYDGYISNGNGSCTSPGTETATCTRCGATDTREAAVPGHKYEQVEEKEATCTEEGYRKYVCSVCGYESEETLPRTEHDYTCVTIYESPSACKCGRVITNKGNVEMDNNKVVGIPKNTSIIVVPCTASEIKEGIFRGSEDIETIYFGENITSLEVWMFEGCTNLKTIYVPEGCEINEPLGLPDSAEIIFVDYSD